VKTHIFRKRVREVNQWVTGMGRKVKWS
jgi:hypothetical protein